MKALPLSLCVAVALLLGFVAYRRGLDDGRARGCNKGIELENRRVHAGWCRRLADHGVSDEVLGTRCHAPWDGIVATESLDACLSSE